jgi:predicted TIM-barrel fold metal-dependent hydrolase
MIDFHCHITTPNSHLPSADGDYYQTLKPIAQSGPWMDLLWAETIESAAENFRSEPALRGYRQMSPIIYSEMVRRLMTTDAKRISLEMAYNHVAQAVVVAIDPFIPTDEIVAACEATKGILLAFGSVDPWSESWESELARVLTLPISGFKFHSNLQDLRIGDPRSIQILQALANAKFEKPIFLHSGDYPIYKPQDGDWAKELNVVVQRFPSLKFVCGHCGYNRPSEAYEIARRCDNLWLETSWQPPRVLRRLCELLGPTRLLLGSDYPLDSMRRAIRNCRLALSPHDFSIVSEHNARRLLNSPATLKEDLAQHA